MAAAKQNTAKAPTAPETRPPVTGSGFADDAGAEAAKPELAETPPPEDTGAPDAPAALVWVRVLVACAHGRCNDVVEIDAELLPSLAGVVDSDPAAVAYAQTLFEG